MRPGAAARLFSCPAANEKEKEKVDLHLFSPTYSLDHVGRLLFLTNKHLPWVKIKKN